VGGFYDGAGFFVFLGGRFGVLGGGGGLVFPFGWSGGRFFFLGGWLFFFWGGGGLVGGVGAFLVVWGFSWFGFFVFGGGGCVGGGLGVLVHFGLGGRGGFFWVFLGWVWGGGFSFPSDLLYRPALLALSDVR